MLAVLSFVAGSPHGRPAATGVALKVPADSAVGTSGVVWRGGGAWFSIAIDHTLRIYRWQGEHWSLDGVAKLPQAMPGPFPSGSLGSVSITGAVAPDFTAHFVGADTWWFAFVARLRGRWRIVPFDDQFGSRDAYTFAYGASHHLILGVFDACGCAGGPTTYQWYRYADGVFVPVNPPARPAICSANALASASHWPQIPEDPLVRHVARSFRVGRFACGDGWALATDGHEISIYEQDGPHWLQTYEPGGDRWLRVGIGSPRLVGIETDFALPRSVLNRLGRRINVRFPPEPRQPRYASSTALSRWQRAPITITIRPGDSYWTNDLFDGRPAVLTVHIAPPRGRTTVNRFRWHDGGWARIPTRR